MPIMSLACQLSEFPGLSDPICVLPYENFHFLVGFLWPGSKAGSAGGFLRVSCTWLSALVEPEE